MLEHTFLQSAGILILKPQSAISEQDVAGLRESVNAYLAGHAGIHGLLIDAKAFPGWEGIEGLVAHMRFVADFHTKIQRVALVTDMMVAPVAEFVVKHLVKATVKHFPHARRDEALAWLSAP
jgi:hypothetical protein